MATRKSIETYNGFDLKVRDPRELTCDECGSFDIKETREGYACGACGMVLDIPKIEYHEPYDARQKQHEPLWGTTIGTKWEMERFFSPTRVKLFKIFGSAKDYDVVIMEQAWLEIARIFNALDLPRMKKEAVLRRFARIWNGFKSRSRYRSVEKLVPLVIYLTMKLGNVVIRKKKLLEVARIGKKEFESFTLQVLRFVPEYPKRCRIDYALSQLNGLREHFLLEMAFVHRAKTSR